MLALALGLAALQQPQDQQPIAIAPADNGRVFVHVLVEGELRTLDLAPYSVRTPDYEAWVSGPTGTREVDPGPVATYRGTILEEPDAQVGGFLFEGRLTALVDYPDERSDWTLEPVPGTGLAGSPLHRVGLLEDLRDEVEHFCDLDAPAHVHGEAFGPTTAASTGTLPIAEVALDADTGVFFAQGSNINATQVYMEGMLLLASYFYEKEVDLQLVSPFSHVWTNENHPQYPYNQPQCTPTGNGQLYDFYTCMAPFWSQSSLPDFDVVHGFLSNSTFGTVIIAGLANFNAFCTNPTPTFFRGWGLSRVVFNDVGRDLNVIVHELGHNLGLPHTPEGIMNPGVGGDFYFPPSQIAILQTKIANLVNNGCFDDFGAPTAPPTVTSVSPTAVQVHNGGLITVTGTNLDTVTELKLDGDSYSYGDLVSVSPTQFQFQLHEPSSTTLGVKTLDVRGAGGTASATLELIETSPIQQAVSVVDLIPVYFITMQAFAGAGDIVAMGWSFDSTLIDYGSWNILAGWNSIDVVTLDGIGFSPVVTFAASPSMVGVPYFVQSIGTDGANRQSSDVFEVCHGC